MLINTFANRLRKLQNTLPYFLYYRQSIFFAAGSEITTENTIIRARYRIEHFAAQKMFYILRYISKRIISHGL